MREKVKRKKLANITDNEIGVAFETYLTRHTEYINRY